MAELQFCGGQLCRQESGVSAKIVLSDLQLAQICYTAKIMVYSKRKIFDTTVSRFFYGVPIFLPEYHNPPIPCSVSFLSLQIHIFHKDALRVLKCLSSIDSRRYRTVLRKIAWLFVTADSHALHRCICFYFFS